MPEGVKFSLRHFLNVPNSQEIRNALESDDCEHFFIKATKCKVQGKFIFEKIDDSKEVLDNYFETCALENQKLCYLTTASRFDIFGLFGERLFCKHGSVQKFTVTKTKKECPNMKGSLAVYIHCDMSDSEFEKILDEGGEVRTKVFFRQSIKRYPLQTYQISIKLDEREKDEQIGKDISHLKLCEFNGVIRIDSISACFKEVNCKVSKPVYFSIKTKESESESESKLLDRCDHANECDPINIMKLVLDQPKLPLGLPTSHPLIHLNHERQNTTNREALDRNNKSVPICSSYSIGRAILEIIRGLGYDSEEWKIINTLFGEIQHGKDVNTAEFNNKRMKVHVWNQNDVEQKQEIELQLKIQTQWAKVNPDNLTINTIPIPFLDKGMKMILRWDIGMTLSNKNVYGVHPIFAKDYDRATSNYSCINNWSEDFVKKPVIHSSRIYAVDYVSVIQI